MLWLELGMARDQSGDTQGAITAFKEATRLAPFYAHPRWQLGNTLIRAGRYDEAFVELRAAVASDPKLFPNLIDLAHGLYSDASAVERAVQPQTPSAQMALSRFFARHGETDEALRLFRAVSQISQQERQDLLAELIAAKHFPEAYEVWASGVEGGPPSTKYSIVDGGFEGEIRVSFSAGFGWRVERGQRALRASLDAHEPHSGARSLLIEWNGDPQPSIPAVSQLTLVEPGKRYRLSFWALSEDLVTAQSPTVTVIAMGRVERLLAQSILPLQNTSKWRQYWLEFEADLETNAVTLAVHRENCASAPCPIFGKTWFDDFTLSQSLLDKK
jgi:hypothetical protein